MTQEITTTTERELNEKRRADINAGIAVSLKAYDPSRNLWVYDRISADAKSTDKDDTMTDNTSLEEMAAELSATRAKIKASQDRLAKRIKADQDRVKELEAAIAKKAQVGDNIEGDWHIKLTPGVRINTEKLAEAYPQSEFPSVWKSEVQAGKVKNMIGADEYSRYQLPTGKNTLTITNVSED